MMRCDTAIDHIHAGSNDIWKRTHEPARGKLSCSSRKLVLSKSRVTLKLSLLSATCIKRRLHCDPKGKSKVEDLDATCPE